MGKRRSGQDSRAENEVGQFREYLLDKELSENTIKSYVASLKQYFSAHMAVTKKDGLDWKRELQERGLSAKTVNVRLNAYNAFCDMQGCPDCKCKTMRVHQATAVSNVISKADYERLLGCLKKDKNMRWYFGIKPGRGSASMCALENPTLTEDMRNYGQKGRYGAFISQSISGRKPQNIIVT